MAVPKVAVIALVAIVAVPIMLGYALNLDEVTVTDYELSGDPVNVTPLLNNGEAYSYAHANLYQINTKFYTGTEKWLMPYYVQTSTTKSSLPLEEYYYGGDEYPAGTYPSTRASLSTWSMMYLQSDITPSSTGYLTLNVYTTSNVLWGTVDHILSAYWSSESSKIECNYLSGGNQASTSINIPDSSYEYQFVDSGTYTATGYFVGTPTTGYNTYANISAGYYFTVPSWNIKLPRNTKSALMTIDFDTITDPNYSMRLGYVGGYINIDKTTDGLGNVTWSASDFYNNVELYYDPSGKNVYQLMINLDYLGTDPDDPNYNHYQTTYNFRYVGSWPTVIGEANYYLDDSIIKNFYIVKGTTPTIDHIGISLLGSATSSPKMRMDDALFNAFQYSIIDNQTYTPVSFKSNPSTTITNIQLYGSSIEFGGNTYTVSGGNITMGTHQIPVKGITLDSVPNSSGTGYDNRINGTVISTTADPSQIVFNGQWSASVSTTAQAATTYTKTEWIAGSFAWNGMDQNFLMAGLITSLGVFIALGIYGRRSGARVLPLMLVCGGAALLFFIMI